MAMIFHTADEIISFDNIKKRWNVDYAELANIVILQELHVFHCYEIRKVDNITQYIGKDYLFSKDDISLYYGDFDAGMSISSKDEVYYFLLTAEVHKYEKENPYLLGRLLDGQEWRDAYGQTAQADSPLSASLPQAPTPLPSPIGRQEEAQDNDRVAELKEQLARAQDEIERLQLQLAEKSGGQGVDATQVEALQKELESTKQALKTATKAPAPQAMGTYWLLLHVLFLEQGIDCRTIDFSTSKTRYATDLEKKIHGIGCTLDDKTIRAKMKEVQAYMDKEKNG